MCNLDLALLDEEEAGSRWWSREEKFMWVKWPHFDPLGVTTEAVMLPGWIWAWSRKAWPARMRGCGGCAGLGRVRSGGTSMWPGGVWISDVDIVGGYGGVGNNCNTKSRKVCVAECAWCHNSSHHALCLFCVSWSDDTSVVPRYLNSTRTR